MCGIAGYLQFDGTAASPLLLRRMGDAIAHRGPDGEGYFSDGPFGVVHRRLAIIDLSPAGHQPMASRDGRYLLAYNGEVYNYQELRIELEALGYQFRSRTDTEVVLHALAQWGRDAFRRLNGMFALAFWDRTERTLLLARDRYGIKPLYFSRHDGAFLFGSEVKAMREHPGLKTEMDPEALMEYMTFQNFLTERTLFKGVSLLSPGTWMQVQTDGSVSRAQYWDFAFREPDTILGDREYEEELDRLFRQAVARQLVGDVPVSSYLSGGMDSGSIAAIASSQIPNLRTFTVGFDMHSASGLEMGFDERSTAEYMSYLFKTEHYEMVLKAGDMERCMRQLVWHLEEPRVGQSYPNFYAAQLASKFGKVVLAGTGGDELFGGYPWRYYRAVVNDDFEHYIDKYYSFWQRLLPNSRLKDVFRPVWDQVDRVWTRDIFRDVFAHHADQLVKPEDYINHSLYFEAKTFLQGLLVVEDKLSMAHSLESRVPFLDNDLVDFAMKLPVGTKLGNLGEVVRINENEPGTKTKKFFERTRDGKILLRRVMQRYIPETVTDAVKQGFSAPDASWFRGESIDYVRDILYRPGARIFEFLDRSSTLALVDEHLNGTTNRRLLIWSLLSLEEWCATFTGKGGHRAA
jgi:asparagine synthase (glutamine-hydrolysing)